MHKLRATLALSAVVFFAAGCGGPTVQVNAINAYRGYADFAPDKDKAVLAKADGVDPKSASVRIFQEAFPEGIEVKEGTFGVADGYQHVLIGKFAYSPGKETPKVELVEHVKRVAIAAGGDAAIVIFLAVSEKNFDVAQGVEAIVIKLDPRTAAPGPQPAPTDAVPTKSL